MTALEEKMHIALMGVFIFFCVWMGILAIVNTYRVFEPLPWDCKEYRQ